MDYISDVIERYPVLKDCEESILKACEELVNCFENGDKMLVCGNGGSCADSQHITAELMKGFLKKRRLSQNSIDNMKQNCPDIDNDLLSNLQQGFPVIPLDGNTALISAYANDCNPKYVYAQQVLTYGKTGDVFLGISTSGNSENVVAAAQTAKAKGLVTITLTGADGGKLKDICDISIVVNEAETYKIQELHLPLYHAICATIEDRFF